MALIGGPELPIPIPRPSVRPGRMLGRGCLSIHRCRLAELSDEKENEDDAGEDAEGDEDLADHATIHGGTVG